MSDAVIITGAGGGIGRAMVDEYLSSGAAVLGIDVDGLPGGSEGFTPIRSDLAELLHQDRPPLLDDIEQWMPESASRLVLVNNAAIQIARTVAELSAADWTRSMNVNAAVPFFLTKALLPLFGRLGGGRVLNISSIHARLTKAEFCFYAASKAALDAITRSLAIELTGEGILVSGLAPAAVSTPMLVAGFGEDRAAYERLGRYHPAGSVGDARRLAAFARQLTSNDDPFLSGSVIPYDSGIGSVLSDPANERP